MAASGHRQPVTSAVLKEAIKGTPYLRTKDSAPARGEHRQHRLWDSNGHRGALSRGAGAWR